MSEARLHRICDYYLRQGPLPKVTLTSIEIGLCDGSFVSRVKPGVHTYVGGIVVERTFRAQDGKYARIEDRIDMNAITYIIANGVKIYEVQ